MKQFKYTLGVCAAISALTITSYAGADRINSQGTIALASYSDESTQGSSNKKTAIELDDGEKTHLIFMREEETLAHDVYTTLSEAYPDTAVFASILLSEANHTGTIAEKLAAVTGLTEPSLAYTGGLLHDIGKVVLDQHLATAFPLFYRQAQDHGTSFMATEKKIFGATHCETGSRLGQNWSFPDSLVAVIKHHHYPEAETDYSELTHIVYLADLLMSRFNTGLELERINTGSLITRLEKLNLPPSRFQDIVDLIPSNVFETADEPGL